MSLVRSVLNLRGDEGGKSCGCVKALSLKTRLARGRVESHIRGKNHTSRVLRHKRIRAPYAAQAMSAFCPRKKNQEFPYARLCAVCCWVQGRANSFLACQDVRARQKCSNDPVWRRIGISSKPIGMRHVAALQFESLMWRTILDIS